LFLLSTFRRGSASEDLTGTDGKIYKNLKVVGETPETVKILHDGGITNVAKKTIPAEFLKLHELAALAASAEESAKGASKELLAVFAAANPSFTTKDGREFNSASIMEAEPSGLKIMSDAGVVRVKFLDLPEKVRVAFAYDPLKATAFERDSQEKRQKYADFEVQKSNAASFVDAQSGNMRLFLVQNLGNGWLCAAQELREQERQVVTARANPFTTGSKESKTIVESRKVRETVGVGEAMTVMVFGLPNYSNLGSDAQGRRTWSGMIYSIGKYAFTDKSGGTQELLCAHIDRNQALDLVVRYGPGKHYTPKGEPEPEMAEARTIQATGTGFAITNDGHLATSAHVVEDATSIKVYVNGTPKTARTVAIDKTNDIAVIKVDELQTKGLYLGNSAELSLGADLFVVGFPLSDVLGTNVKFTKGSLSSIASDSTDKSAFQMSVPIQPGNSGGPVCNMLGSVCGVVRSGLVGSRVQNVNQAVVSELLKKLCVSNQIKLVDAGKYSETPEKHVVQACYLIAVEGKK
jgi:S1-C subfamily serine protease